MKRKQLIALMGVGVMSLSLVGCGDQKQVAELRELPALNAEADVQENYSLSYTDKQNLVYAQVSNRTLLDLSALTKCDENSIEQVKNYLDNVDDILVGNTKNDGTYIDSCFTDYLLANFETTPYYWQRTKTTIRGMDAESRAIIVDVTYKTIDFDKECKSVSTIPLGCNGYELLVKTRYERLTEILTARVNNPENSGWQDKMREWEATYGSYDELYKNQVNTSLTDNMFETGNQVTYSGLQDSEQEQSGGTLTVRYVLIPNYTLGINLGITCKHMYLLNYKLDNDPTEGVDLFTEEGYDTVTDAVYELMYSYFTCIDESDFYGLCSLSANFGNMDRYYYDMFETSYRKHDNFSLSIFSIQGTHITCGVSVGSKERAKGSNMLSMPSYTDRYYVECDLVDGKLVVDNIILLSKEITGEPAIRTEDADTSGYVSAIELTSEDKQAIENLICNFGAVQLNGDEISDEFSKVVDISMAESDLTAIKTSMKSLSGAKKVVFLINYQQGTSNYASVKCKENFQSDDNSIVEANTTYDFIKKGGSWYIYKYTVNASTRLDTTNLATNGSLCLVSPGKVESYTSQIQSTGGTTTSDNTADTVEEFEHKAYTPKLKTGSVEQGNANKVSADTITNDILEEYAKEALGVEWSYIVSSSEGLDDALEGLESEYLYAHKASISVYYNYKNNLYSSNDELQADILMANTLNSDMVAKAKEAGVEIELRDIKIN